METGAPQGLQVTSWLQAAERHVLEQLSEEEAGKELLPCLRSLSAQLPVSYSFTPIAQLLALQRSPCVSLLGWDTEQFQQWSREGLGPKSSRAPPTTLPRARLLLVGYITDRPTDGNREHDGNLYVRDASGCVPCEFSQFDCSCLGSLLFFPCWTYIPTHERGGYVEVLSPANPVTQPEVTAEVPAGSSSMMPESALLLLGRSDRPHGSRISVTGHLSSVTSLVTIRKKTFFFFFLQDTKQSVPVIVQVPSKLSWYHELNVGDTYEVTSLALSSLRGSPHQVLAVTPSSLLLSRPQLSPSCPSTPVMENSEELMHPSETKVSRGDPQERATRRRHKESKTLSYKGVVTRVLNAPAGLYELDGALLLCTAYTQLRGGGRGLRVGARVEVCDVHLQQSPSPLFPTLVLSCCLRSRLRICDFSRLDVPCVPFSGSSNLYLHLLFRYRLRLPEYLWVCDVMDKLQEKLCPRLVRQTCITRFLSNGAQGPAEKLLFPTLSSWPSGRTERDLLEEMVADPHDCPLQEYCPLPPPWCLPPLSLFPSMICSSENLRGQEANQHLHWSHYSLRSGDLSVPHVLLGVLQASSSGSLLLKDQSSSLTCLVLPAPVINWIGCVVEVRRYQLVTEILRVKGDQEDERSRVYAVFLAEDVRILHSSHSSSSSCPDAGSGPHPPVKIPRREASWAQRHLVIKSLEGRRMKPGQDKGLQFRATASWVDIREEGAEARRSDNGEKSLTKLVLLFSSVRWFHFLQPNKLYRLTATGETDSGIFDRLSDPPLEMVSALRCLQVPADWTLEDVEATWFSPAPADLLSIEEALKQSSSGSLLTVTGVVCSRLICDTQNTRAAPCSAHKVPDVFLPPGASIKVTLTQPQSQSSASVYLDVSNGPYHLGLLPGATVMLQGLERKVSRSGRVYLRSVPTTHLSVLSPPTESFENVAAPPLVLFKQLTGTPNPQRAVCSVTCVLSVTLYWDCSGCGSAFVQGACLRSAFCNSPSGVFRAKAWVKAEDGSGAVRLYLQDEAVLLVLGISRKLWEALQGRVLSRGKVVVRSRGRSEMPGDEHSRDPLVDHMTFLMTRPAICRPLVLTFRERAEAAGAVTSALSELTRFTRAEREYVTRVPAAPVVTCVQLQEAEPRALCHMIRDCSQSVN
ncbi:CST complex subunit CTC1 isoform X1 [Bufo bufo]|uniref:CST complex subunit CTC1 isoform X1 n=1 Tax=Bufo bufo TaxID=8384 RepID=UPI001ABDAF21|nr:CST complex subunit CTC1 isoform X1 [Bufo bufo]